MTTRRLTLALWLLAGGVPLKVNAGVPAVTTLSPSNWGAYSLTLNAEANPNGAPATGWFRISETYPGSCNDTFGTRVPASGGVALGSGTSTVTYAASVTGLTASTGYYACAIVQNADGIAFSSGLMFGTAPTPPSATTLAASSVSTTSATLNGSVNPNGQPSWVWFRYATTNPGTCNGTFGVDAPAFPARMTAGTGTSAIDMSWSVTGLSPGTTYYYCVAAASGEVDVSFGGVASLTTLPLPTVTTNPATSVTATSARLNGLANPGGSSATGWFRYSAVHPGACNDSFGTRIPAAGGTSLGSGTSAVAFSQAVTGLAPGTTYYACAIAANPGGSAYGGVVALTTLSPPAVSTSAASSVTSDGATLSGTADPRGVGTTAWFRWATTDPGTCSDAFGSRVPAAGGAALGSGVAPVAYAEAIAGLAPGTWHWFCAVASSAGGTSFGEVQVFQTSAEPPEVTTGAAAAVTTSTATVLGTANPGGAATTAWFRYASSDPGACDDAFGTRAPASGGTDLGAGTSPAGFAEALSGLAPATTYYYCALAENAEGTRTGAVRVFTTPGPPAVVTEPPTGVSSAGATLNGSAAPNRLDTVAWFRIAAVDPGACDDAFGDRAPPAGGVSLGAGPWSLAFSEAVAGLAPATTYYACAIAENEAGKRFGDLETFTTAVAAPSVTTAAPTAVTNGSAVLNGAAVPNGRDATGWFRWDTSHPGTCDDAFGTRVPPSCGSALGAGTASVAFSSAVAGLARGTTYYHCAIAENAEGKAFGAVEAVVPGSTSPIVATGTAAVAGTSATLAGTADPNGSAAIGWFRLGDSEPTSCDDAYGIRAPAAGGADLGTGNGPVAFETTLADLEPNRTFWFCAAATNAGGATFGAVRTFTTASVAPAVTTLTPIAAGDGAVTLQGLANPRGTATTAWFRVGPAGPEACDDSFGTRWPSTGGTEIGQGRSNVQFGQSVTGLAPGAYRACAIASNAAGAAAGVQVAFEVPARDEPGGGGCGYRTGRSSDGAALLLVPLLAAFAVRRRRAAVAKRS